MMNKGSSVMPTDQHEAMIRTYIEDVFNRHNLDNLGDYMSDDLVSHWLGDRTVQGLPAWKKAMEGFFTAFPDAAYTLDDLFFADDKGVWRGTWRAVHKSAWEGIPASGREVIWTAIIIGRFSGGKLAEDWVEFDRFGLFKQLGAMDPQAKF
jgi:predicted ester cyclase